MPVLSSRDTADGVNHKDELNSAVQLPKFRLVAAWHAACIMHDACYVAQG